MQNEFPSSKGELVPATGATGYIGGRLVPELLTADTVCELWPVNHATSPIANGLIKLRLSMVILIP